MDAHHHHQFRISSRRDDVNDVLAIGFFVQLVRFCWIFAHVAIIATSVLPSESRTGGFFLVHGFSTTTTTTSIPSCISSYSSTVRRTSTLTHSNVHQRRSPPFHRQVLLPLLSSSKDSDNGESGDDSSSSRRWDYDLAVVGAGVVGVQAALAAASGVYLKKRVCLIDAPREAGVLMAGEEDLSIGAPTGLFSKALRDTSKRIKVSTLRGMGLREDSIWNEIINSCVDLASSNAQDIRRQMEENGVDYIEGLASFPDSGDTHSLRVVQRHNPEMETDEESSASKIVTSDKILVATGSTPFRQSGIPFDGQRIFDSDSINQLEFLPKSIAITGSGIIAVEFAKIFRNLGVDVTMIIRDKSPRNALMKIGLDKDVAATLVADMVRSGIKIERNAQVGEFIVDPKNPRAPVTIALEAKGGGPRAAGAPEELRVNGYLAAVGRKPNTSKLNLEAAGIEIDEYGGIMVNPQLCTTAKDGNVYAAGDVLGRPFLASTGVAQGIASINSMFGPTGGEPKCDVDDPTCVESGASQAGASFDPASLASNPFAVPSGIWSTPEAAYFGLSQQQAQELGMEAGEGIALYSECLRGRVFSPNGLLKIVFEKPAGRILGVHICGDDACELIHYGMELVNGRRTVQDLTTRLFAAVTFHEMYRLAAEDGLDPALGRKRRAAAGKALAKRNRLQQAKTKQSY